MSKIAFLFPGQGAQYVGMAKDLYSNYPEARETFDRAEALLGYDYKPVCFEGPEDELKKTYTTQPAIFLTARCCSRVVTHHCGIRAVAAAGHSLGEYNALTFAGALHFDEAVRVVRNRGIYMHEASLLRPGTMAAIIGFDQSRMDEICRACGEVQTAALNSPGQVVISGAVEAVQQAIAAATAAGAGKAIPLKVSGAWHSMLMKPAEDRLAVELNKANISKPLVPVVANTTARYETEPAAIRAALVGQLTKPVRWVESMQVLLADGIDTFIEVGPGTVLSGLLKRINRQARIFNVQDVASMEKTMAALTAGGQ